jgi:glycosyltransferase involved in cell wall biosynthesis
MKICFYAPFKPLGHRSPSGDAVTAAGIFRFLAGRGHELVPASSLRCRWIFWKPWLWLRLLMERRQAVRRFTAQPCDIWFSYHSYYKAPDVLGPAAARRLRVPYVLFQGIFSTKRRRDLKTLPGFLLNRKTLRSARHVFTNKKIDLLNLKRLIPEERITYVAPGLRPDEFSFSPEARARLRAEWGAGDDPVVLSVAMFRRGVKADGLGWVIRAGGDLLRRGRRFSLVIVGDGREREGLMKLAEGAAPGRVRFAGQVARPELFRYYSAADLFVFPGIRESLGMVYLEAQSCGLPVVAFDNAGTPEAIQDGRTGLLVPMGDGPCWAAAIDRLLSDPELRRQWGQNAKDYVREFHDLDKNYGRMEEVLRRIADTHGEGVDRKEGIDP